MDLANKYFLEEYTAHCVLYKAQKGDQRVWFTDDNVAINFEAEHIETFIFNDNLSMMDFLDDWSLVIVESDSSLHLPDHLLEMRD